MEKMENGDKFEIQIVKESVGFEVTITKNGVILLKGKIYSNKAIQGITSYFLKNI